MLRLYKDTAVLAFQRAVKAWPVAFSVILYALIMLFAMRVASGLGIVGGFLLGLVGAACAAGYLHLLAQAVGGRPVSLEDLKTGFSVLFWDVISVMFALWIIDLLVTVLARGAGPNGEAILAMVAIATAFFLNPVPEFIYQQRSRSFELLLASARFVLANPVAWLLPNLVFVVLVLAPTGGLSVGHPGELLLLFGGVFSAGGIAGLFASVPIWAVPLLLLLFHYAMIFRGLLFEALASGNPRRRAWQAISRQ